MKFFFQRLFQRETKDNQEDPVVPPNQPEEVGIEIPLEEGASVPAYQMKNWCDKNLSPVAWARILLRNLPYFTKKGFALADLQNPSSGLILNPETFKLLKDSIKSVYGKNYFESKKTFI